jgi:hypothetical protein
MKKGQKSTVLNSALTQATVETSVRGGQAAAEFMKAYSGIDHETGQIFNRSLKKIAESKINPNFAAQNIKQQAGFSAEVLSTAQKNADSIIRKSSVRTTRSEDLAQYGKNHPVVDQVDVVLGKVVAGTEVQIKFVGNTEHLVDSIVSGKGKQDLSRYQNTKLGLPTEQVDATKAYCTAKAQSLRQQADAMEKLDKQDLAQKYRENAKTYERVGQQIEDTGLTTKEAIAAREHPKLTTAKKILSTSHQAATEAAKIGASITGVVSLATNAIELAQGEKSVHEAIEDTAVATGKAAAITYGSTLVGSTGGAMLRNSHNSVLRSIGKSNLPHLAVSFSVNAYQSIKKFHDGELSSSELAENLGEQALGLYASNAMATLSQIAIPIPIVGAAFGGMVGALVSQWLCQSVRESQQRVKASRHELKKTLALCAALELETLQRRAEFEKIMATHFCELQAATQSLLQSLRQHSNDADAFAQSINQFALTLGQRLQFSSVTEFEVFMSSDAPLVL